MRRSALIDKLDCVKVDKGVHAGRAVQLSKTFKVNVQRYGGSTDGIFRPIPQAWKVEVAHGKLARSRRMAKSFENTTSSASLWLQLASTHLVLKALVR